MAKRLVGYEKMDGSEFVPVENAFDYVLKQCGIAIVDETAPDFEEFKKDFVDWSFSGPWVEVYENGEE